MGGRFAVLDFSHVVVEFGRWMTRLDDKRDDKRTGQLRIDERCIVCGGGDFAVCSFCLYWSVNFHMEKKKGKRKENKKDTRRFAGSKKKKKSVKSRRKTWLSFELTRADERIMLSISVLQA